MAEVVLCAAYCWTAKPCPAHGDSMPPRGRSAPLEMHICCDRYMDPDENPRHLWDEHDSTRSYNDPEGWRLHELNCAECAPETKEQQ